MKLLSWCVVYRGYAVTYSSTAKPDLVSSGPSPGTIRRVGSQWESAHLLRSVPVRVTRAAERKQLPEPVVSDRWYRGAALSRQVVNQTGAKTDSKTLKRAMRTWRWHFLFPEMRHLLGGWLTTVYHVLRLRNCPIQLPPLCLNPDPGVGENIVHYMLVLAKYWIQLPPPLFDSRFTQTYRLQTYTIVIALSPLRIEQAHAMRLKTISVAFTNGINLMPYRASRSKFWSGAWQPHFKTVFNSHFCQGIGKYRDFQPWTVV